MAALVLGLVISTVKNSYDTQNEAVKHTAAKVLLLDRVLANYGPETREARDLLRKTIADRLAAIWPEDRSQRPKLGAPEAALASQEIEARLLRLSPDNEVQRSLRHKALEIGSDIAETRWFMLGGLGSSVPVPFLIVVVSWLTILFGSFGVFAPRNATVLVILFLCALSVSGSIFLILEMDQPFEGLIKISSAPLRYTLSQLGQ